MAPNNRDLRCVLHPSLPRGCCVQNMSRIHTKNVQPPFYLCLGSTGRNIKDYDPTWLRTRLGFVMSVKDTALLHGKTIKENVELGRVCRNTPPRMIKIEFFVEQESFSCTWKKYFFMIK